MRILYHCKTKDSFIIKVNYASAFTVTLPLYNVAGYNYHFKVQWGDGTYNWIYSATDASRIHTYASGGTYTITMTGTLQGWVGNATGLKEYITEVTQWGRTGFKSVSMSTCARLVSCYGKLITSQTSFNSFFLSNTSLVSVETADWDISNVTNYYRMFYACSSLTNINLTSWQFNTTSNIDLNAMFHGCSKLTTIGDVSDWNTSKFYNCTSMFNACYLLNTLDCGRWNMSNVVNTSSMFTSCNGFTTIDIDDWNVTSITNFSGMFTTCVNLTTLNTSAWSFNTSSNINFSLVFVGCTKLTTIGDTSGWVTSKFTTLYNTFAACNALISVDCTDWNTSLVTDITGIFWDCKELTSLDLSAWNTSNIWDMSGYPQGWRCTFGNCIKLTSVGDLSGWDVSNATQLRNMFYNCTLLTTVGDISVWNPVKCTTMESMFHGCSSLTSLNLANWDVSKCTSFDRMFQSCTGLTSLNVTGWTLNTTTSVTMLAMFYDCRALTSLSFTGWNTSKVTNFQQFLDNCLLLTTCDVTVLSTAVATNVSYMFRNCRSMTAIDISGWDLSLVTAANMTQSMFYGCYGLTSLTLPSSLSRVDNQFAVFTGTPAITVYNINRSAAPTVSGTPFGNYAKPLHVPVSNSGYDVTPWTNTAIFSSVTYDL